MSFKFIQIEIRKIIRLKIKDVKKSLFIIFLVLLKQEFVMLQNGPITLDFIIYIMYCMEMTLLCVWGEGGSYCQEELGLKV